MDAVNWLRIVDVLGAHTKVIEFSGGSDGLRDIGLLESALARPQNLAAYAPDTPLTRLAAAYGFGIAANHPFVDGNKRTAFIAVALFLDINGVQLDTSEEDKYVTMMSLAAGDLNEQAFAEWLNQHTRSTEPDA